MAQEQKSANDLAVESTDLAVNRTVMAADRTMMAWVRTGLSLIGFGFTIYKFLESAMEGAQVVLLKAHSPRRFGLTLIALGIISMILGCVEYVATIKNLNRFSSKKYKFFSFSMIVGLAIGLLGLILFVTIFINKEVF
jgi:putative membrane protein